MKEMYEAQILFEKAQQKLDNNETSEADIIFNEVIQILDKIITKDPGKTLAFILRGNSKIKINLYESAMDDFTEAIRLDPYNPLSYIERAKYANSEQSEKDLLKAIELDPQSPYILSEVAIVKEETIGTDATTDHIIALRAAIKENDKDVIDCAKDALSYLYNELLYRLDDLIKSKCDFDDIEYKELVDRLQSEFSELIELYPTWEEPYFNRGYLKIESLHDYHGAIQDYDKYTELKPNFGLAYYNRGEAKFKLGDSDGAKDDFMKAKKLGIEDKFEYYG